MLLTSAFCSKPHDITTSRHEAGAQFQISEQVYLQGIQMLQRLCASSDAWVPFPLEGNSSAKFLADRIDKRLDTSLCGQFLPQPGDNGHRQHVMLDLATLVEPIQLVHRLMECYHAKLGSPQYSPRIFGQCLEDFIQGAASMQFQNLTLPKITGDDFEVNTMLPIMVVRRATQEALSNVCKAALCASGATTTAVDDSLSDWVALVRRSSNPDVPRSPLVNPSLTGIVALRRFCPRKNVTETEKHEQDHHLQHGLQSVLSLEKPPPVPRSRKALRPPSSSWRSSRECRNKSHFSGSRHFGW